MSDATPTPPTGDAAPTSDLPLAFRYDLAITRTQEIAQDTGLDWKSLPPPPPPPAPKTISAKGQLVLDQAANKFKELNEAGKAGDIAGELGKLFLKMPIGDLPGGEEMARFLGELPLLEHVSDLATLSFDEIGSAVGKVADKKLRAWLRPYEESFKRWGDEHKGVFYSLVAVAAVGAGYLMYDQGTAVLDQLGVKPRIKREFFDNKLKVVLGINAEPRFKAGSATLGIGTNFGNVEAEATSKTTWSDKGLTAYEVGARLRINDAGLNIKALEFTGLFKSETQKSFNFGIVGTIDRVQASLQMEKILGGEAKYSGSVSTQLWGSYLSATVSQRVGGNNETRVDVGIKIPF